MKFYSHLFFVMFRRMIWMLPLSYWLWDFWHTLSHSPQHDGVCCPSSILNHKLIYMVLHQLPHWFHSCASNLLSNVHLFVCTCAYNTEYNSKCFVFSNCELFLILDSIVGDNFCLIFKRFRKENMKRKYETRIYDFLLFFVLSFLMLKLT